MPTEAIHQDVSADNIPADSQPAERELSPREAKMAALISARDEEVGAARGLPGSTDDLPALYGVEADPWDETGGREAAPSPQEQAAPDSPVFTKDGEQYMRIKVNGVEQDIPLAQVQAVIQKNVAADSRLQEASQRLREVEARERQLQEQQQQIQQSRLPNSGVDSADSEALKAEAKAIIDGLYEGETDEASERLAKLLAARNTAPTVNMADVQKQAEQVALRTIEQREYVSDLTKGRADFDAQFPEIVSDPELFNMADQKTIRISQANPSWTPTKVLMEAGKEVRDWLRAQRGEAPAAPSNSRQANKEQLRPMPTAQRNAAHVAPREPVVDATPTGVISRMRAGRGQV